MEDPDIRVCKCGGECIPLFPYHNEIDAFECIDCGRVWFENI